MFNKIILIGRLGQNAEAKTSQNNREFVVLNIATQERTIKATTKLGPNGIASSPGAISPSLPGRSRRGNSSRSKEFSAIASTRKTSTDSRSSIRSLRSTPPT